MNLITILGFVAAILSTFSFLPQAIKCWKTRQTKDISLPAFIMLAMGVFLWTVYGFIKKDIPVLSANFISFLLVSSVLLLKIKYG